MTPEERRIRANNAKHLQDNPLFKEAFSAVANYIESKAESCDPDNKDMAQRIVLSKQILAAIKREIQRVIDEGAIAAIQIQQLEKQSVLRRLIR